MTSNPSPISQQNNKNVFYNQSGSSYLSPKKMDELITPEFVMLSSVSQRSKSKKSKKLNQEISSEISHVNYQNIPTPSKSPQKNPNSYRPSSPPTRDVNNNNHVGIQMNAPRKNSENSPCISPSSFNSSQRWAGASYTNAPAPSQLPKPVFLTEATRTEPLACETSNSTNSPQKLNAVPQIYGFQPQIHVQHSFQAFNGYHAVPNSNSESNSLNLISSIPSHSVPVSFPHPPHVHQPPNVYINSHPQPNMLPYYPMQNTIPFSVPPFDPHHSLNHAAFHSQNLKSLLNIQH